MTTFIQLSLIHGDHTELREQGVAFFGPDGCNKIPMIKMVRDTFPGASLKDCKEFVDKLVDDANYTFHVMERKKINDMLSRMNNDNLMKALTFISNLESEHRAKLGLSGF